MIKCNNLIKKYDDRNVVDNISFSVNKGTIFALLGANGAGKTTTIKMILNLIEKDSGDIAIKEGSKIGYSPETPHLPEFMTAKELMHFYGKLLGMSKVDREKEIEELLDKVNMIEYKSKKIKGFSKGMLQRLGVAQSLLNNPDIVILDEPTAGLDAFGRIEMIDLIKELKNEGKTIILNSHILNDVEKIADEGIIIKRGKIMEVWNKEMKKEGLSLEEIFIKAVGGR